MQIASRVIALVLAATIAGALSGCSASPTTDSVDAADPGGSLVATKCVMCHSIDRVNEADYDKAGWETVVTRMQENGLVVTPEEKAAIIDYLAGR